MNSDAPRIEQFTAIRGRKISQRSVQRGRKFLDNHFNELHHGRDNRDEHDKAQEAQIKICEA